MKVPEWSQKSQKRHWIGKLNSIFSLRNRRLAVNITAECCVKWHTPLDRTDSLQISCYMRHCKASEHLIISILCTMVFVGKELCHKNSQVPMELLYICEHNTTKCHNTRWHSWVTVSKWSSLSETQQLCPSHRFSHLTTPASVLPPANTFYCSLPVSEPSILQYEWLTWKIKQLHIPFQHFMQTINYNQVTLYTRGININLI